MVEFTAGPGLGTFGDRLIGANYLHERFINELFSVGAGAGYSYHLTKLSFVSIKKVDLFLKNCFVFRFFF